MIDDKLVTFEAAIGDTTAAYARLGRALVKTRSKLRDSHVMGETVVLLVSVPPAKAEDFAELLKAWSLKYSPPTYFHHGSLMALYASPADELAGNVRLEVQRAMARDKEREEEEANGRR